MPDRDVVNRLCHAILQQVDTLMQKLNMEVNGENVTVRELLAWIASIASYAKSGLSWPNP